MVKKLTNKIVYVAQTAVAIMAAPFTVWAQNVQGSTLYRTIVSLLNAAIVIIFILMTLFFVWGVFEYVRAGGDDKKIDQGKKHMIWGIIGMAVAAAAWGLVGWVLNLLGLQGGSTPNGLIPTFNL